MIGMSNKVPAGAKCSFCGEVNDGTKKFCTMHRVLDDGTEDTYTFCKSCANDLVDELRKLYGDN